MEGTRGLPAETAATVFAGAIYMVTVICPALASGDQGLKLAGFGVAGVIAVVSLLRISGRK